MFKSKEINESQFLNNTTLPRLSETCNGTPKITSTPLNPQVPASRRNKVLSPAIAKQGTPRRYSLSEVSPSTSRSNLSANAAHSPGPLLASLSFKDNVSMYEETRSSGLARRIVLYNEEAEQERRPTHQEKYSSLGLFPIVHLFKKRPPLLEQSPKRVKIKLSSPEYIRSYSPQHRNTVLEGITRNRLQRQHSLPSYGEINDTGTKSVLDALKEISRKRIHTNEGHDPKRDSGKRIRTELSNGSAATSKRTRADSPVLDLSESPTSKQSQKKFCVYDEFAASKSSSDFSFLTKPEPLLRSKRKTISTSTESLDDTKHVKLVNVETQTTVSETKAKSLIPHEINNEKSKKKECAFKVFDDAPLDRIRKSRLAALMGNLVGKDAAIQLEPVSEADVTYKLRREEEKILEMAEQIVEAPVVNSTPQIVEVSKKTDDDQPLVSILSTPKSTKESSAEKSDRHVQFNVSNPRVSEPSLTQTSSSIVTPIVCDSISKSPSFDMNRTVTEVSFPVSSATETNVPTPSLVTSFSFGNPDENKSNIGSSSRTTPIPIFSFTKSLDDPVSTTSSEKLSVSGSNTVSPQKPGGFKFDLKTPPSSTLTSVTKSNTPTLNFPTSSLVTNTSSNPSIIPPLTTTSGSTVFSFGKPSESKKEGTFSFGASNKTSVKNSSTSEPAFSFGGLSKSPSFNFGSTVTTTAESKPQATNSMGEFSFGASANSPKFGDVGSSSQVTTNPSFGSLATTVATGITNSSSFSVPTTSSGFGSAISSFGVTTTTTNSAFGDGHNVSKAPPTFTFGGSSAVTTSSVFGTKPNQRFSASSTTPAFAHSASLTAASPGFGNNPTTNITFCSAPTTSTPVFGNTSVPAFGTTQVTKTSVFGSTPTTTSSVFGSTPTTTASIFGTPTGFGSIGTSNAPSFKPTATNFRSNPPAFGSHPTTTASVFGTVDAKSPSFGSSNLFGTTTQAPTFGNNTTSTFGSPAQPPSLLGGPSATKTSNPPPYGSSAFNSLATTAVGSTTSAASFGTSNSAPTFSFGSNKPTTHFGTATTTSASTFGTSSAFSSAGVFNPSSGFGASTTAFGQAENKPSFAFGTPDTKNNSVFGSGTGNSAFGKPTSTQSGFSSGFGSANASGFSSQQTNGGFNFRSNAAPSSVAPFGFGAAPSNSEPSKPSFSFTGGASTFGASSTTAAFGAASPTFGGSTPTFAAAGAPPTGVFNAAAGAPPTGVFNAAAGSSATGVFNIGAGSATTGRPRTQLRAKRRT